MIINDEGLPSQNIYKFNNNNNKIKKNIIDQFLVIYCGFTHHITMHTNNSLIYMI